MTQKTTFSVEDLRRRATRQVLPTDQPPEGATTPDAKPMLSFTAQRRGYPPSHLADLDVKARKELLKSAGLPGFRADQISRHYFGRCVAEVDKMPDVPASMHDIVTDTLLPTLINSARELVADEGRTLKTVWELFDNSRVESVLMGYKDRVTLCVSSQAGCGMACPFCATGQMGFIRNLSTGEILEQVRHAMLTAQDGKLKIGPNRLTNVVFMGMGEPLVNYRAIVEALHRMIDPSPEGFGLSARNITVSTVGLVPSIYKLADLGLPVTLAVSLHAPDDELRDDLIPANSRWKVGDLLDAAYHYYSVTGRRVSIEYALIQDMNDHVWRAQLLADELNQRGRGWAHVNPIPLNPTPGSIWTASLPEQQDAFVQQLRAAGIRTTIRDTRGSDIDGACGQLATEVNSQKAATRRANVRNVQ
ncbi:23S rRNA (adenine(2503)-C(2))-methyltransferase RlmN [Boudabousia marimammalium]|uniref:Probable dual-specificity RNA methyltransferase RlmN n=1 Tax=Boudabousia marimammalium TaxID=156892 RepID=A0A1Q5PNQ8_9ACTO|nr:23S rRNA (adenine(2503)-C(2))-methyltransferase RlmN [Boudabousia marimammalium]OKL49218.1 23S rRNA (adenine(2503)-C(2))-methyltransferase RlmN [Boudabousia marimammalium]